MRSKSFRSALFGFLSFFVAISLAPTADAYASVAGGIAQAEASVYSFAWIALLCSVVAGTLGTGIYFSSLVRSKNTLATIGQVLLVLCVSAMTWVAIREVIQLVFENGAQGSASTALGFKNLAASHQAMALLIICSGLIVGGAVERLRLLAVVVLAIVWSALVFAPGVALMWGINAPQSVNVLRDWGGASAHLGAGAFAFGVALATGSRIGYGRVPMPPYHMAFALVGSMCLFIGWSGYNEFGVVPRNVPAYSGTMNCIVAACTGFVVWACIEYMSRRVASTLGMVSGGLAAVVATFAIAGWVSPLIAMLVGGLGSVVGYLGAVVLRRAHAVDDSLDMLGIHALPAVVGLMASSVFNSNSLQSVFNQSIWIVLIAFYAFSAGWLTAFILKKLSLLRVTFDEEDAGLDLAVHGETVHPPQSTL